jgi:pSer/pThr/pTyr-binding forkhead associated (FHA) protein
MTSPATGAMGIPHIGQSAGIEWKTSMLPNSRLRRRRLLLRAEGEAAEPAVYENEFDEHDELDETDDRPSIQFTDHLTSRFAQDCGLSGRFQIEILSDGDDPSTTVAIDSPCFLIGREDFCDVVLSGNDISRRHAYVQALGGQIYVADLGSRTGILCDGRRLKSGYLPPDEILEIGGYRLQIRIEGNAVEDSAEFDTDREHLTPEIALEFFSRVRRTRPWNVDRALTLIGAGGSSMIKLAHPSVARVHCSIVQGLEEWWLVDLGCRRGTLLDGEKIRFSPLIIGSEIEIGTYAARVCPPVGPELPAASRGDHLERLRIRRAEEREGEATGLTAGKAHLSRIEDEVVVELFREFAALHERTIAQMQASFREMLEVAVAARSNLGPSAPSPSPGTLKPVAAAMPLRPLPIRPAPAPLPRAPLNSTADPESRDAARLQLAEQLQAIESQLKSDQENLFSKLFRRFSGRA